MNEGFAGCMVIMGQGSPNSIFVADKCQLVSFQIRKDLDWLFRQFVHWFFMSDTFGFSPFRWVLQPQ